MNHLGDITKIDGRTVPKVSVMIGGSPCQDLSVAGKRSGLSGETPPADFLNVTAWRQTAEFITRYFRKASSICVIGAIQTRSWTDKDGQKRFVTEIVADEAYFVDAKSESAASPAVQNMAAAYMPDTYTQAVPNFEEIGEEEVLPF